MFITMVFSIALSVNPPMTDQEMFGALAIDRQRLESLYQEALNETIGKTVLEEWTKMEEHLMYLPDEVVKIYLRVWILGFAAGRFECTDDAPDDSP